MIDEKKMKAIHKLQNELSSFSHDGLIQLKEDLLENKVEKGSWGGCVLSYKRGYAGSVNTDNNEKARNLFTIEWDGNRLSNEEVVSSIDYELDLRENKNGNNTNRSNYRHYTRV